MHATAGAVWAPKVHQRNPASNSFVTNVLCNEVSDSQTIICYHMYIYIYVCVCVVVLTGMEVGERQYRYLEEE